LSISPRGVKRGLTPGDVDERRATPSRVLKKPRHRFEEDLFNSAAQYDSESTKVGDVEIQEDDTEGKFVKLCNKGEKVIFIFS
jgi:hypothetical protein